jgi:apolipoprotein N-acyltransferase
VSERNEGQRNEEATEAGPTPPPPASAAPGAEVPEPWPRRKRWPAVLGLGLLFGTLVGIHVLDNGVPSLAYLSTVPWALICLHPRLRGRMNLVALAIGYQTLSMIGLYFLRGQNTPTWIIAPVMYWPLYLLMYPPCRLVMRRWPRFPTALLWPLTLTGIEWLRIRLAPGELSLCHLAYSQIRRTKMIQIVDLGGTAAVSFHLAAVGGLLAAVILSFSLFPTARERWRWLRWQLAGVAALTIAVLAYGLVRDSEQAFHDGPTLQILQTDTPRSKDPGEVRRVHDFQVLQTLSTMRPGEVDAILWPENSVLTPIRDTEGWHDWYLEDLKALVDRAEAPLFFDSGWILDNGDNYHTAFLMDREGELQHHWKVRLLPWTEYVPLKGLVQSMGDGAMKKWLAFIEGFVGFVPVGTPAPLAAVHPMVLEARDGREYRFGTPICFEIATPRVVNRWTREGVDFLINPTSEGRLGDTVHVQTIAISGFRAIEARVPVVRVTNDGISGVIDANGRPHEILSGRFTGSPVNEAGVLFTTVPLDARGITIYSRFGDWLPIGCLLIVIALSGAGLAGRRKREA